MTEIREVLKEVLRTWLDGAGCGSCHHALIFAARQKPSISHTTGMPAYDERGNHHDS